MRSEQERLAGGGTWRVVTYLRGLREDTGRQRTRGRRRKTKRRLQELRESIHVDDVVDYLEDFIQKCRRRGRNPSRGMTERAWKNFIQECRRRGRKVAYGWPLESLHMSKNWRRNEAKGSCSVRTGNVRYTTDNGFWEVDDIITCWSKCTEKGPLHGRDSITRSRKTQHTEKSPSGGYTTSKRRRSIVDYAVDWRLRISGKRVSLPDMCWMFTCRAYCWNYSPSVKFRIMIPQRLDIHVLKCRMVGVNLTLWSTRIYIFILYIYYIYIYLCVYLYTCTCMHTYEHSCEGPNIYSYIYMIYHTYIYDIC